MSVKQDSDHGCHAPVEYKKASLIGIALKTAFGIVEAFHGWKIVFPALLADAAHNLIDLAGLPVAWGAVLASKLRPKHSV